MLKKFDSEHPLVHFLAAIGSFFAPVAFLLLLVGIMIFFDTMVGRWCARELAVREGKIPRLEVTSKKTRIKTGEKMLFYFGIIITVYILDREVLNAFVLYWLKDHIFAFIVTKLAAVFLMWWEFDSIDEKYFKVKGVRIKDKVKQFFEGIKDFILKLVSFKKKLK